MSVLQKPLVPAFRAAVVFALASAPCAAQSLHGSDESVARMYRHARAERLTFYETSSGVRRAVTRGRLERLVPNGDFTLHEVGYPFVQAKTLTFVQRLGAQYRSTCGEPLEVTSAVRPATRQPPNSVAQSVHPTGMAVDLHKPDDPACRSWLKETLLELEGAGVLEATEEFAPPHFHVAVYPTPYGRYVAARQRVAQAGQTTVRMTTYRVRPGDTLWDIARAHDTSVAAIRSVNHLETTVIKPGDDILIPQGN